MNANESRMLYSLLAILFEIKDCSGAQLSIWDAIESLDYVTPEILEVAEFFKGKTQSALVENNLERILHHHINLLNETVFNPCCSPWGGCDCLQCLKESWLRRNV